jgi:hypothetical protein
VPYQRLAAIFLVQWREVERMLAEILDGGPVADVLQAEADRLRNEYQHLIDEATRLHQPVPEPFPVDPA